MFDIKTGLCYAVENNCCSLRRFLGIYTNACSFAKPIKPNVWRPIIGKITVSCSKTARRRSYNRHYDGTRGIAVTHCFQYGNFMIKNNIQFVEIDEWHKNVFLYGEYTFGERRFKRFCFTRNRKRKNVLLLTKMLIYLFVCLHSLFLRQKLFMNVLTKLKWFKISVCFLYHSKSSILFLYSST